MATVRIADQVGRVLGQRYRLLRPLGTGASAHVYVGEDVTLRRRVAVKVLHPALAGDEAFLRRFRAEARVVAALRHPNILRVYDWGEDDGSPYLVTELLEGGSLRTLLDAGHLLSPAQAARVGADAARALAHAHRRGLVHRDVKPANLLFDDEGRVSVADFGLARALAEASWTEPAGAVLGTARYAAPEQARGQSLDARGDVYALALVLVEATTGEVPFTADTTIATLMARLDRPLPVPPTLGPLAEPLRAAGTADPAQRLDAIALAAELDRVAAQLPPPSALVLSGPLASGVLEVDPEPTAHTGGHPRSSAPDAPTIWVDDRSPAGRRTAWVDPDPTDPGMGPAPRGLTSATPPGPGTPHGPYDDEDEPFDYDEHAAVPAVPAVAAVPDMVTRPVPAQRNAAPTRRKRGRRWLWRFVAVVVVLAAVAAALVATGVLPPAAPREAVPSVIHEPTAQAAATLRGAHLRLAVVARAYSNDVPAGSVIAQRPAASQQRRLHRGGVVSVTVSKGPAPVPVPSLTGKTTSQAAAALRAGHLQLGAVVQASSTTVGQGLVISWAHPQGTVTPGTAINVVVSSGLPFVAVPALSGSSVLSLAAAQRALSAAGLASASTSAYSNTVPEGQVVATTPPAGSSVRLRSVVTVTISKGPDTTPVGNVTGDSVSGATSALEGQGLVVSGVQGNPTDAVTGTYPQQGVVVRLGTSVEIITS